MEQIVFVECKNGEVWKTTTQRWANIRLSGEELPAFWGVKWAITCVGLPNEVVAQASLSVESAPQNLLPHGPISGGLTASLRKALQQAQTRDPKLRETISVLSKPPAQETFADLKSYQRAEGRPREYALGSEGVLERLNLPGVRGGVPELAELGLTEGSVTKWATYVMAAAQQPVPGCHLTPGRMEEALHGICYWGQHGSGSQEV